MPQQSQQPTQQKQQSPEDVLKLISQGKAATVLPDEERKVKMVEVRKKIPNIILRKTVTKLRKNGKLNDKQILNKIMKFDELAEKDELIKYLQDFKKRKAAKKKASSK